LYIYITSFRQVVSKIQIQENHEIRELKEKEDDFIEICSKEAWVAKQRL